MGVLKTGCLVAGLSALLVACSAEDSTSGGGNTSFADAAAFSTLLDWNDRHFRCGPSAVNWSAVNDWHYQLQKIDYEEVLDSGYDLLVIDSEPRVRPNRNVIDRLKCTGDNEKIVLSYLSIGQAEDYRYYYESDWKIGSPDWIVAPDPVWEGDYFVKYWDPEWRSILMGSPDSRVDRIVDAGFDGVYLDTVDAYTFFQADYPNAINEMQQLVEDIAVYARQISGNPNFGVFVQNAEELISIVGPEWVEPLTGIGKEEGFYWATDERVSDVDRSWSDLYLGQWVDAGKVVLSVDFVTTEAHRQDAIVDAKARGYVPLLVSSKELDRMDSFPDHLPD